MKGPLRSFNFVASNNTFSLISLINEHADRLELHASIGVLRRPQLREQLLPLQLLAAQVVSDLSYSQLIDHSLISHVLHFIHPIFSIFSLRCSFFSISNLHFYYF